MNIITDKNIKIRFKCTLCDSYFEYSDGIDVCRDTWLNPDGDANAYCISSKDSCLGIDWDDEENIKLHQQAWIKELILDD